MHVVLKALLFQKRTQLWLKANIKAGVLMESGD